MSEVSDLSSKIRASCKAPERHKCSFYDTKNCPYVQVDYKAWQNNALRWCQCKAHSHLKEAPWARLEVLIHQQIQPAKISTVLKKSSGCWSLDVLPWILFNWSSNGPVSFESSAANLLKGHLPLTNGARLFALQPFVDASKVEVVVAFCYNCWILCRIGKKVRYK